MKKYWVFLFCGILPYATLQAQNMERVRQTVQQLSAADMHGRGYVNNGSNKAAAYIGQKFQDFGLKPFSGSYFQQFSLPVNTFPDELALEVNGKELQPGLDFIAHAASAAGSGKAWIFCLDTLIFSNEAAGKKFLKQKISNKVLVLRQQDQEKLVILPDAFREKVQQAQAVVVLQPERLVATVARTQARQPVLEVLQQSWPKSAKKIKFKVDAEFKPDYEVKNVIGYVPGTLFPDSFVVFTAHYDHLGQQGETVFFPGANDNASGTAMLLELAAWYAQPENQPTYSVAFMAFAAEEAGLLGSEYYTQQPLFPLPQIKFLINVDLMGTGEAGMMVVNGQLHRQEFLQLQHINQQKKYLPDLRSRGKAANSDHYHFSEKGVKAFFFYTLGGSPAYHHVHDMPDKLSLAEFSDIFKLITDFALLQMQP